MVVESSELTTVQYLNVNKLNSTIQKSFKNFKKSNSTVSCSDLRNNSNNCNDTTVSNEVMSLYSSTSFENLGEDLWDAFQEHYEYLMDEGLIETCQLSGTQTNQNQNENVSGVVSFTEFLHQFNELTKWLNQMQSMSFESSLSSCCEKYANQIFYEEILKRSPRRKLLNEYARHLVKYHPHLKNDVLIKLHYLNKQWKSMEFTICFKRYYDNNIVKDLDEDINKFKKWLEETECIIENLAINQKWHKDEVETNLNNHKFLQSNIESQAKVINSVLKLSAKLKQLCPDCSHFYDNALLLQDRWHCLWLKSLEWQCRLEQQLSTIIISSTTTSLSYNNNNNNNTNNNTKMTSTVHTNENNYNSNNSNTSGDHHNLIFDDINSENNTLTNEDLTQHNIELSSSLSLTSQKEEEQEEQEQDFEQGNNINDDDYNNNCNNFKLDDDDYYYEENDDVIPFDECEYEKISTFQTSSSDASLTNNNNNNNNKNNLNKNKLSKFKTLNMPRRSFESNSLYQNNINSYYSLTNINYYNIDENDDLNSDDSNSDDNYFKRFQKRQHEHFDLNTANNNNENTITNSANNSTNNNNNNQIQYHLDIGYSSDNGLESPKQDSGNGMDNNDSYSNNSNDCSNNSGCVEGTCNTTTDNNNNKNNNNNNIIVNNGTALESGCTNKPQFYKTNHGKSLSDYCVVNKNKNISFNQLKKYKRFFSRYSRISKCLIDDNEDCDDESEEDYVDDDDDDEIYNNNRNNGSFRLHNNSNNYSEIQSSSCEDDSLNANHSSPTNKFYTRRHCSLEQYRSKQQQQQLQQHAHKPWKQSSTTSAYDTSSNASTDGCNNSKKIKATNYETTRNNNNNTNNKFEINNCECNYKDNKNKVNSNNNNNNKMENKCCKAKIENDIIEPTDILSIETSVNETTKPIIRLIDEKQIYVNNADETSTTTNTDVSDPHWDGYTASSYYHGVANAENDLNRNKNNNLNIINNDNTNKNCNNNNNNSTNNDTTNNNELQQQQQQQQQQPLQQPILPWDVFFELEPNDVLPQRNIFTHNRKLKTTKRHYINNSNCINTNNNNNNNYHHYLNNNNNTNLNSNSNTNNCCITKHHHYHYHHYHHRCVSYKIPDSDDSEMEELTNIISDSCQQYEQTNKKLDKNLNLNDLYTYNEIIATCKTNIECLENIKGSLDKCDKEKSKDYSDKLEEILNKWKNMEPLTIKMNFKYTKLVQMSNDVLLIKGSLDRANTAFKDIKFKSTSLLKYRIKQAYEKMQQLSELADKLKELKIGVNELVIQDIDVTVLNGQLDFTESYHQETGEKIGDAINEFNEILKYWEALDVLQTTIQSLFNDFNNALNKISSLNKYEHEVYLREIEANLTKYENILENIKSFMDLATYDHYRTKIDKFKFELNNLPCAAGTNIDDTFENYNRKTANTIRKSDNVNEISSSYYQRNNSNFEINDYKNNNITNYQYINNNNQIENGNHLLSSSSTYSNHLTNKKSNYDNPVILRTTMPQYYDSETNISTNLRNNDRILIEINDNDLYNNKTDNSTENTNKRYLNKYENTKQNETVICKNPNCLNYGTNQDNRMSYNNENNNENNNNKEFNASKPNIDFNMQLDFNDLEETNFQMTSTPRYKQESNDKQYKCLDNNNKWNSKDRQYNSNELPNNNNNNNTVVISKNTNNNNNNLKSDKCVATFDNNFSQTDTKNQTLHQDIQTKDTFYPPHSYTMNQSNTIPTHLPQNINIQSKLKTDNNNTNDTTVSTTNIKIQKSTNNKKFTSVDSGLGVFDNTTSDFPSCTSSPLSHSFVKTESFDANEDKENEENDEHENEKYYSHHEFKDQSKTNNTNTNNNNNNKSLNDDTSASFTDSNDDNYDIDDNNNNNNNDDNNQILNVSSENSSIPQLVRKRANKTFDKSDLSTINEQTNSTCSEPINNNNTERSGANVDKHLINDEDVDTQICTKSMKKTTKKRSWKRLLCNLFLFICLILFLLIILFLIFSPPSCCDFRSSYLFYNHRTINNEPLPF